MSDPGERAWYDVDYCRVRWEWAEYRQYEAGERIRERKRKGEERRREEKRQDNKRRRREERERLAREEEQRREGKRREDERRRKEDLERWAKQEEADRRSAKVAQQYRQEQARIAEEKQRKQEEERLEQERAAKQQKTDWQAKDDELRRSIQEQARILEELERGNREKKQQEADRRSEEAALRYRQEQARVAKERIRRQEEQNRKNRREEEDRKKDQKSHPSDSWQQEEKSMFVSDNDEVQDKAHKYEGFHPKTRYGFEEREQEREEPHHKTRQSDFEFEERKKEANGGARTREAQEPRHDFDNFFNMANGHAAQNGMSDRHENTAFDNEEGNFHPADLRPRYIQEQNRLRMTSRYAQWSNEKKAGWIQRRYDWYVAHWVAECYRTGTMPNTRLIRVSRWLTGCRNLLDFLEQIPITPQLRSTAELDSKLKIMYSRPDFRFTEDVRQRAKHLYEKWELLGWGSSDDWIHQG